MSIGENSAASCSILKIPGRVQIPGPEGPGPYHSGTIGRIRSAPEDDPGDCGEIGCGRESFRREIGSGCAAPGVLPRVETEFNQNLQRPLGPFVQGVLGSRVDGCQPTRQLSLVACSGDSLPESRKVALEFSRDGQLPEPPLFCDSFCDSPRSRDRAASLRPSRGARGRPGDFRGLATGLSRA